MPLHYPWQKMKIDSMSIKFFINKLQNLWQPRYISIDTETTGVHITQDKPFYLSFAFIGKNKEAISAGLYLDSINEKDLGVLIRTLFTLSEKGYLIGHNIAFDLNMLENIGYPIKHRQLLDTMVLIRLTTDAVQEKHGGAPLGLTKFATQYIDRNANSHDKQIKQERTRISRNLNNKLFKTINRREFHDTMKFPKDISDLPEAMQKAYETWYEELPEQIRLNMTTPLVESGDVPYNMIPSEILSKYAVYDAIYTFEIFDRTYPLITLKQQEEVFKIEQELTYPLYKITREGFYMNKEYIFQAKLILKRYIENRITRFQQLAGKDISISQIAELKGVLNERFKLNVSATNDGVLSAKLRELYQADPLNPAIEFIEIIAELRTLSKWYSTYLMRFHVNALKYDTIHTTLNPAGAVTGRFTSDFQQFPRGGIKDNQGNILFNPREMITRPDDNHYLLFIDYSQMELRIQALYTILLGHPDRNLCQAYMPYECYHYQTRDEFDFTNAEHLARWGEVQPNGKSAWIRKDTFEPWIPTDVHAQTTAAAYPEVDRNSNQFRTLRGEVGKAANFACNYGAKANRIHEMFPHMTFDEANNIYNAYRETFPGTVLYHQWCYNTTATNGYGENLFKRRYYNINGHNYMNAAIQGTGADMLKMKMIELFDYLEPYQSKLIMTVHDELIFLLHRDELHIIDELKAIMEFLEGTHVPIVVDTEISNSTWAQKKGFKVINGLLTIDI